MVQVSLAPVSDRDISDLISDLLPEDQAEILAMGFSVEWGVRNSVETSLECVAIRGDGRLAAMVGISQPVPLGDVQPWLLGTPLMREHPLWLLRLSKKILARWRAAYPYLTNHVDARHCVAITWLSWLGAELTLEPEFGPFKRPFYKFEFGEPSCA